MNTRLLWCILCVCCTQALIWVNCKICQQHCIRTQHTNPIYCNQSCILCHRFILSLMYSSNLFIISLMYSKVIWASTEHLSSSFHWTTSYVHTGPHSLIILLFSTLLFCLYLYTCILIYLYYVHLSTISHHCLGFALRELA